MRALLRGLLAALLVACGSTPGPVALGGGWPERAPSYETAHERWTRHAEARRDLAKVLDVFATLKSAEWRAARVAYTAERLKMSDVARAALEAEERAAAEAHWEVELIIATSREWADFASGARSMWRVALEGPDGREVVATSIQEDKRPRSELEIHYPDMTLFHRAWVAKFPKTHPDGTPVLGDGKSLKLKIASAQTAVEMVWTGE